MIYKILKFILAYACRKYFVEITIVNEDNIPNDKPVLLLPNHRSAFLDPIIVGSQIKRKSNYLARGESFNNPVMVKIYKRLNMIPIYRKEHNPEKTHKNEDIFRHCHQLLEEKGCLMIFPEGICQTKYILAPLKVGTAKIALEAENKNNFNLDVHLVPIGINFTNPHRFRGKVTINIGEAIRAKDFEESYKNDSWKGVEKLTNEIDKRLRRQILILEEQSQINDIARIEELYNAGNSSLKLNAKDWHNKRLEIQRLLGKLKNPSSNAFKYKLNSYYGALHRLGIDHLNDTQKNKGFMKIKSLFLRSVLLTIGLPIFIVGFLLHILPFIVTRKFTLKVVQRIDWVGSIAFAFGLLVFAIFCGLQIWGFHKLVDNNWLTFIFFMIWPSLGLFTYGYLAEAVKWFDGLKWWQLGIKRSELQSKLNDDRNEILNMLQKVNT